MKVLITGGAGFIGSNLARFLLDQGDTDHVRIVDDFSTGSRANLQGLDVELLETTILDDFALLGAVRGVDSIVHLAAVPSVARSITNPRASHEANATGTLNVLEAAREASVEHVIVASSSSVYGANPVMPKEERTWTRPMSPYAVSKLATEAYTIAYQSSFGLKTLAFRFFNVYGPYQAADHAYAAVIPRFLDAALRGRPVQIEGDGKQSRDFTYVDTLCQVVHQALTRRIWSPDPINLAFGTNTDLLSLLGIVEEVVGHPVEREFIAPRPGDVHASQADSTRLHDLVTGIQPLDLRTGVARTAEWLVGSIRKPSSRPDGSATSL